MSKFEFAFATLAVLGLVSAPVACSMNDNYTMERMVSSGVHPIDARCAVSPHTNDVQCAIRAAGKGESK